MTVYVVTQIGEYPWDAEVVSVYPGTLTWREIKKLVKQSVDKFFPDGFSDMTWEWEKLHDSEWTYAYDDGAGDYFGFIVTKQEVEP